MCERIGLMVEWLNGLREWAQTQGTAIGGDPYIHIYIYVCTVYVT